MLPHLLLRIAIALATFGAGLLTATVFGFVFGTTSAWPASSFIETKRPDPPRKRPCPRSRQLMSELPPLPAVPELPPPPPAPPKPTIQKTITIKLPDGTVRVVESRVEETVERKL